MVIFHSYVSLPEGISLLHWVLREHLQGTTENHYHQMLGIPCHQGPGRQLMDTHHVLSRRAIGSKQHANR